MVFVAVMFGTLLKFSVFIEEAKIIDLIFGTYRFVLKIWKSTINKIVKHENISVTFAERCSGTISICL